MKHWGDRHWVLPATTVLRTSFSLKPQVQMTQNPLVISINTEKKWVWICHSNRDNTSLDKKCSWTDFQRHFSKPIYRFPGDPPKPCFLITEFKRLKQLLCLRSPTAGAQSCSSWQAEPCQPALPRARLPQVRREQLKALPASLSITPKES